MSWHSHGASGAPSSERSAVGINDGTEELAQAKAGIEAIKRNGLARAIAIIDVLVTAALWCAAASGSGTDGKDYFYSSVVEYDFRTSLFDVTVVAVGRGIVADTFQANVALLNGMPRRYWFMQLILLGTVALAVVKAALLNWPALPTTAAWDAVILGSIIAFGLIEIIQAHRARASARQLLVYEAVVEASTAHEVDTLNKNQKVSFSRLFKLVVPEYKILSIALVALLINSATTLILPKLFGDIVDALVEADDPMAALNKAIFQLLVLFAIGAVSGLVRGWLFTLAGHRVVVRLRSDVFASVVRQEIAFFDASRTGDLTSRLSSDTQLLQNAVTTNISMLLRYSVQVVGSVVSIFIISWPLSLVMFSVVPVIAISAVIYGRYLQKLQKQFQDELAAATTVAEEVISNMRTVRSFSKEAKAATDYENAIMKSYFLGRSIALAYGVFNGLIGFVPMGAIALVLWYGGTLVIEGRMTAGLLTTFLIYTLGVAMALAFMSALYGDFMAATAAATRLFQLLDRTPTIQTKGGKRLADLTGRVEFKDVTFQYPARENMTVLKNISITLEPGKVLALVGPSGSGKSTVVSLVERFYDVTSGAILIDGVDLRELDPEWYRSQVSLVSQEPVLFATTIRENILFGTSRQVSEDEILAAAKAANAHDFITSFPDGYATMVGERGVRLSGGQKQRVAIARALLMNPRLLILDEATSALDSQSEHVVQDAIDRAMQNRTVLIIAHRLSTVKNADCIAVVSEGSVVEMGTHAELLSRGGLYLQLVNRQLQNASLDASATATPATTTPLLTDVGDKELVH